METDAPAIFEYAKNPNVTQWTSWDAHKSIKDSLLFIRHVLKESQTTICQPFGIILKQKPNKVVGTISFSKIPTKLDSEGGCRNIVVLRQAGREVLNVTGFNTTNF